MFIVYNVLAHCRVGSLETIVTTGGKFRVAHCRVGSLEIGASDWKFQSPCSLPCR